MNCRHCGHVLEHQFLDLGFAPPSNAYLTKEDLTSPEVYYPLKLMVCSHCWLVQTLDYTTPEQLFNKDYAYFSSTSISWLKHAARYCETMIQKFDLGPNSFVLEIACNDGYLLKNFVSAGVPCLGIEPTSATATAAEGLGIPVVREFFGERLGEELAATNKKADLIAANNVYAHVPDVNDFTRGLKQVLKKDGVITLEFPHLQKLIEYNQFDTVYHEHFSYFSLETVQRIFEENGLRIWNVEELSTHGGSLRVFGCHVDGNFDRKVAVDEVLTRESRSGLRNISTYEAFQAKADLVKHEFLRFVLEKKAAGLSTAGYGAAAKGNTLLNYAGVKVDLIPYICDAAPSKQGKYMPGSHIPIVNPSCLAATPPDFLVIFPWNIAGEIRQQNAAHLGGRTRFVTAVPRLEVI